MFSLTNPYFKNDLFINLKYDAVLTNTLFVNDLRFNISWLDKNVQKREHSGSSKHRPYSLTIISLFILFILLDELPVALTELHTGMSYE